ncbi:MAG: Na+/H+ antiporter subunit E [Gammaproteobacteria bacterium]
MSIDRHLAVRLGLLAGLWWLLTDGDTASWVVGLPAVAAALWAARRLRAPGAGALSVPSLLRLVPLFLWESLRGGVDVAQRTLSPRLRVRPGLAVYRIGLQREDARVFFTNCVSLLPGTLAADLDGDRLDLHLLDSGSDPEAELRRLEQAVARVYPHRRTRT